MLDKMIWRVFEKTGNIDIYLLYVDYKNIGGMNEAEIKSNADNNPSQMS